MTGADDVRDELAKALPPHQTWCQTIGHFDCCGASEADCDCGVKDSLDELEAVVLAYGERQAGKALRDAADAMERAAGRTTADIAWLRARAEAASRGAE